MMRDSRQARFDWGKEGGRSYSQRKGGKENRVDNQEGSGDRIQASVSPTQTHNIEETLLSIY